MQIKKWKKACEFYFKLTLSGLIGRGKEWKREKTFNIENQRFKRGGKGKKEESVN